MTSETLAVCMALGFFLAVVIIPPFFIFDGPEKLAALPDWWDERHYRRLVRQRARGYMRLGLKPATARLQAAKELENEAREVLTV